MIMGEMAMVWTEGEIHPKTTTVQLNLCYFCHLGEFGLDL